MEDEKRVGEVAIPAGAYDPGRRRDSAEKLRGMADEETPCMHMCNAAAATGTG